MNRTVDDELNQQLFFHVSEVLNAKPSEAGRPDLRDLLKPGDEVTFIIDPSKYNDGRLHAKQVSKLKAGTIKLQDVDAERRKGVAEMNNNGAIVIRYSGASQHSTKQLQFHPKNDLLQGSDAVEVGDVVEFCLSVDKSTQAQRAVDVEVIAKALSEQPQTGQCLVRLRFCCTASLSVHNSDFVSADVSVRSP